MSTERNISAISNIAVAVIDLHPMKHPHVPQKIAVVILNCEAKKLVSYETAFSAPAMDKLCALLDEFDKIYDLRLVGDNVALLGAHLFATCRLLSPPRSGPQYRIRGGELVWTPWLDIESLQLGFMRSTQDYMWNIDPARGESVEETLSKVIQIPPPLEESDENSPQLTSERVALMYVSQLRHSMNLHASMKSMVVSMGGEFDIIA